MALGHEEGFLPSEDFTLHVSNLSFLSLPSSMPHVLLAVCIENHSLSTRQKEAITTPKTSRLGASTVLRNTFHLHGSLSSSLVVEIWGAGMPDVFLGRCAIPLTDLAKCISGGEVVMKNVHVPGGNPSENAIENLLGGGKTHGVEGLDFKLDIIMTRTHAPVATTTTTTSSSSSK